MTGPAGYLTFEPYTPSGGTPEQDPRMYVCGRTMCGAPIPTG